MIARTYHNYLWPDSDQKHDLDKLPILILTFFLIFEALNKIIDKPVTQINSDLLSYQRSLLSLLNFFKPFMMEATLIRSFLKS